MKELEHDFIDVLKIDIEGGEFEVIQDMAKTGVLEKVEQLMFEFHYFTVDTTTNYSPGSEKDIQSIYFILQN